MAHLNSPKDSSDNRNLPVHHSSMLQDRNRTIGEIGHLDDYSSNSSSNGDVMKQVKAIHEDGTGLGRTRNRNSIGSILSTYGGSTASQSQGSPADTSTESENEDPVTSTHRVTPHLTAVAPTSTEDDTLSFISMEPTIDANNHGAPTGDHSDNEGFSHKAQGISQSLQRLDDLQQKMDDVLSEHSSPSSPTSSSSGESPNSASDFTDSKITCENHATSSSVTTCVDATEEVQKHEHEHENKVQTYGMVDVADFDEATDGDAVSEMVFNVMLCWMLGMVLDMCASTG